MTKDWEMREAIQAERDDAHTAGRREALPLIKELVAHLPNSIGRGEDWGWCWNELFNESQEDVVAVRAKAEDWLRTQLEQDGETSE